MLINNSKNYTNYQNSLNYIEDTKKFGFWIYMMSDCIMFATMFATYEVLKNNTANGPTSKKIFKILFVFIETIILLTSSLIYSMIYKSIKQKKQNKTIILLIITFILGLLFLIIEIYEFYKLINKGYTPNKSAFLSSFYVLIGSHGIHIIIGLIWIFIMLIHIINKGLTIKNETRLYCLGLFWHFLDIIWICIFTIVYLIGVI